MSGIEAAMSLHKCLLPQITIRFISVLFASIPLCNWYSILFRFNEYFWCGILIGLPLLGGGPFISFMLCIPLSFTITHGSSLRQLLFTELSSRVSTCETPHRQPPICYSFKSRLQSQMSPKIIANWTFLTGIVASSSDLCLSLNFRIVRIISSNSN